MKFYHLLILLSGDISLNPDPSQYLPGNDNEFEPFRKCSLHVLQINVDSFPSKIDELRDFVGYTKPAILGITESKLDSSVSDQKVNISGYWVTEIDMVEVLLATLGLIYALIGEMFSQIQLKIYFSIYLFQVKASFNRYFRQTTKCKCFSRNLSKRFETY